MRRTVRVVLILALGVVLGLAGTAAFAAFGFDDVPSTNVHGPNIQWSANNGIFEGDTAGNFNPGNSIRRDQAASVMRRLYDVVREEHVSNGELTNWYDENIAPLLGNHCNLGALATEDDPDEQVSVALEVFVTEDDRLTANGNDAAVVGGEKQTTTVEVCADPTDLPE